MLLIFGILGVFLFLLVIIISLFATDKNGNTIMKPRNKRKVVFALPFIFGIAFLFSADYVRSNYATPIFLLDIEVPSHLPSKGILFIHLPNGFPDDLLERYDMGAHDTTQTIFSPSLEKLAKLNKQIKEDLTYYSSFIQYLTYGFLVCLVCAIPCGIIWIAYFIRWLIREMKSV